MALVNGTNCGFVTIAPVADPSGSSTPVIDGLAIAIKVTVPAGKSKITGVRWWCDYQTQSSNFEVGLYSHNIGSDAPDNRLYVDTTNAVGDSGTWQTVAVDWDVTPETIYWIAVQVDAVGGSIYIDYDTVAGVRRVYASAQSSLLSTWPGGSSYYDDRSYAICAIVEEGGVEYADISGTISAISSLSGSLSINTYIDLSGTISATSSLSGDLIVGTWRKILTEYMPNTTPTFAGLILSGFEGILKATTGVLSASIYGSDLVDNIVFDCGTSDISLDTDVSFDGGYSL